MGEHLDPEEQQAMRWVEENSGNAEKFLVLGSQFNPAHSSLSEWFPALADRQSITTVQGQEWLGNYHQALDTYSLFQRCFTEDLACIQEMNELSGLREDCIFISFVRSDPYTEKNSLHLSLLQSSLILKKIYSSPKVKIFC